MLQVDGYQDASACLSPTNFFVDAYKPMHIINVTGAAHEILLDNMAVEYMSAIGIATISEADEARARIREIKGFSRPAATLKPSRAKIQPRVVSQPNRFLIWGEPIESMTPEQEERLREKEAEKGAEKNKKAQEWLLRMDELERTSDFSDESDTEADLDDPMDSVYTEQFSTQGAVRTLETFTAAYAKGFDPELGKDSGYDAKLFELASHLFI